MTTPDVLPDPMTEPTISIQRAGRLLGISKQSAYNAAADGTLPSLRFGHRLVVPTARLLALLGQAAYGNDVSPTETHTPIDATNDEPSADPTANAAQRREQKRG